MGETRRSWCRAWCAMAALALGACDAEWRDAGAPELPGAVAVSAAGAAACRVADAGRPLPKDAMESSGLARSRRTKNSWKF